MDSVEWEDVITRYQPAHLIKQGGQKAVYRVHDYRYGEVVLKIGKYKSAKSLERIEREVDTLLKISSRYYPKVYSFEKIHSNRFVIIEEHIESRPLSACLSEYSEPKSALNLLKEIVEGLRIIWDKRIVHRDLKPDNILITSSGLPVIIDLGIARLLDLESLTQTHAPWGPCTPTYAAPEQLLNAKDRIDFRTDQFNLGIILLQLLMSGTHPFEPSLVGGESIPHNIVAGNWYKTFLEPLSHNSLRELINTLLGQEPFERYRKGSFLLTALHKTIEEV